MNDLNIYILKSEEKAIEDTSKCLYENGLSPRIITEFGEISKFGDPDVVIFTQEKFRNYIQKNSGTGFQIFEIPFLICCSENETYSPANHHFLKYPFTIEDFYQKMSMIQDQKKASIKQIPLKFYEKLVQNSTDIVAILDVEGIISFISPSVKRILDYKPEELLGRNVAELMPVDEIVKVRRILKVDSKDFNKITKIEFNLRAKNDEYIPFEGLINNSLNDELVGGFIVNARDIKERKNAEQVNRIQKETFYSILQNAPFGVVLLKNNNEFEFANREFTIISGFSTTEFQNIAEWFNKVYPQELYGDKMRYIYDPKILRDGIIKVIKILTRNLEIKDIELRVSNLDETRKILICHDITEMKKSEQAINNSLDLLAANKFLVESRNKQLAELNERLVESEKRLIDLNLSKDKFFSILAHDLRAPFNGILGLSQLAITDYDYFSDSELKMVLEDIYNASKNIFNLLENLLSWAKVNSGMVEYKPEMILLNELIIHSVAGVQYLAKKKNISLINNSLNQIKVYADSQMIFSVVQNLITNAIKFTPRGKEVGIETKLLDDNFVEVNVYDNGTGMTEEQVYDLFKLDKCTTTSGTENEKGSGLGLLLCKEFIEKNGGKISINSKINKGTSFRFTLPVFSQ